MERRRQVIPHNEDGQGERVNSECFARGIKKVRRGVSELTPGAGQTDRLGEGHNNTITKHGNLEVDAS